MHLEVLLHSHSNKAGSRVHIPFYILVQDLHKEAKLFAIQVRLVSRRKLQQIKRQTFCGLRTKVSELWDDYAYKDISVEQLLKPCSHLSGPVRSY